VDSSLEKLVVGQFESDVKGHDFQLALSEVEGCRKRRKRSAGFRENLCWMIVADTCCARAELAAAPVPVDGHAPEALVPAGLLPKCKAGQ